MAGHVTLTKVTRNGQITLPASVRRATGIEEGDLLAVTVDRETVILTPKRLVDKSQAYFWSDAWQQGEREANEDIAEGRVGKFRNVEELITALEAGKA
jgi:AbrB family looped-hinge helix DNA binding protein